MATAKFHVGSLFNPDDPIDLFDRVGDSQPSFDPAIAVGSLTLDDEGYVEVDGEQGDTFWLFQATGEDDNGAPVGQQVSVTMPDPDAQPLPTSPGDDPATKIADDQAAADAAHEQAQQVIDSREQEELKHSEDPEVDQQDAGDDDDGEPKSSKATKAKAKS